ncbi:uncharacterized protein PAM68-like [Lotus japonicus]|uniref:uncharacterized protein PAM68-like n=1 Tax=Lotus japonicus TaxID=34305 RepID=UPI00258F7F17|nr:uncharacterized protein PAM68-like [Lotus japonicus]XP_057446006.1 uncharacterized protein PAM68-like [Lotus japonicus]XP_057446007.1 uncharacterized protein PAM68-like [Lotus japonicus]XP_057446008.1 uncharacterized protein PAM68-like [Lotus japonicus]XP_057446009.1 uncharacterized protein PAM68-like [Lotus japonicus]
MKSLVCASHPTLYLPNYSSWKPKFRAFHPITAEKQPNYYPLTTPKPPRANAKGFSNRPSTTETDIVPSKNRRRGVNEEEDEELPRVVLYRIIGRILFSVGVPLVLGLALLDLYGELKDRGIWDAPLWIPFTTTLLTFGASTLGIAYGTLSASLDAEREGTFLGLNEVQRNWVEMWEEEDKKS